PSRWIESVDDKVKIRKTAEEAKAHWRDEERNGAFFNEDGSHRADNKDASGDDSSGPHILNRSFSGTY
ncbi:MAG: SWFGD domain-containing protein, partial [Sphingomonas sp.]